MYDVLRYVHIQFCFGRVHSRLGMRILHRWPPQTIANKLHPKNRVSEYNSNFPIQKKKTTKSENITFTHSKLG